MRKSLILLMSLVIVTLFSCTSYKKVNYFQGLDRSKDIKEHIDNYSPITIQEGDILGITVGSLNAEGSALFNGNVGSNSANATGESGGASSGYLVDKNGEIQLPLISSIKVAGLTTPEIQVLIKKHLVNYLKEPVVNVRLLNFKFSVLGDVGHPGVFSNRNDRITIPEALSMAGDLTPTAKRKNILLIREIDGNREFTTIDITSRKLFESNYYYLKNNDVLYIEADKAKYAPTSGLQRNLPIILSVISLGVLFYQVGHNR